MSMKLPSSTVRVGNGKPSTRSAANLAARRPNMQDATLRNIRALKEQVRRLRLRVARLEAAFEVHKARC